MIEELKEKVFEANQDLVRSGLVILTWGNASAIDRERGLVVIKPSGVSYAKMQPNDMLVEDLDGKTVEGNLRPSSDLATHLVLYRSLPEIGGVVHTHSTQATAWAQAARPIPNLGTTHADHFHENIAVTDEIPDDRIAGDYEHATGEAIVAALQQHAIDPLATPAILVAHHGPFTWGANVHEAVLNAIVLEEVAKMAQLTFAINPLAQTNPALTEKHYSRKHGPAATYGQARNMV